MGNSFRVSAVPATTGWNRHRAIGISAAFLCLVAGVAEAQVCSTQSFAVAPTQFSGAKIKSVSILTNSPDDWMARAPLLGRLHTRTHTKRILSELLFAPGDSVDTLRIAESMRRIRAIGLFDRTALVVSKCAGVDGVDLAIVTRDEWTLSPVIKARGRSADIGLSDRNAFGTGSSARIVLQSDGTNFGFGMSARVIGKPAASLATELGSVRYGNGQSWHAAIGNRTISSADRSTLLLRSSFSEREPRTEPGNDFQRSELSALFGRRFSGGLSESASYFLFGAETEHADLHSTGGSGRFGARAVRRSYAGINAGAARIAARYDTVSWLLSSDGIVDVPSGVEGEVVIGVGRDRITGKTAQHIDMWTGRAFLSGSRNSMLLGDVWASGFAGDDLLSASTLRTSWTLFHRALRGYWTWRFTGERLANPDPDVRALASADLLAPALPKESKLAEGALAFSAERIVHLRPVTRSLVLDGALFGGASYRWDAAVTSGSNSFGAIVVGAGFRLSPSRTPRNSVRLDFGMPITRSASIRRKPYVALTLMTWPLFDRQRDGRKTP